jgi:hypothetical protein
MKLAEKIQKTGVVSPTPGADSDQEDLPPPDIDKIRLIKHSLIKSIEDQEKEHQEIMKQIRREQQKALEKNQEPIKTPDLGNYETIQSEENIVNSFAEINWIDPFGSGSEPKKSGKKKPKKLVEVQITQLVYDESKFLPENPPNLIFVPSRNLMLKLMRICCECKDTNELHYLL